MTGSRQYVEGQWKLAVNRSVPCCPLHEPHPIGKGDVHLHGSSRRSSKKMARALVQRVLLTGLLSGKGNA